MKLFALTILIACVQVTSAAMPGLGVTDGFGVPMEAAIGSPSQVWEDCNNTAEGGTSTWTFLPGTMGGCKAKCKEKYPAVSAAEFLMETNNGVTAPKCCCLGLTEAQSKMTWCHYSQTGSSAYYWLTCDTMAEPKPCGLPGSLNNSQKLAIYQNGTWDCKAAPTPTPTSGAKNNGALMILSTLAPLLLTLLLAFCTFQ